MSALFCCQFDKNLHIYVKCFIAFNFIWNQVILIIFSAGDNQCFEISKKYNV